MPFKTSAPSKTTLARVLSGMARSDPKEQSVSDIGKTHEHVATSPRRRAAAPLRRFLTPLNTTSPNSHTYSLTFEESCHTRILLQRFRFCDDEDSVGHRDGVRVRVHVGYNLDAVGDERRWRSGRERGVRLHNSVHLRIRVS